MLPGNISEDQAKSHINNFWNYLDELAEKNPEEYKKFISSQIQKGYEGISETPKEIKVTPYMCLRFKILSVLEKMNKDNIKIFEDTQSEFREVPKILFSYDFQTNAYGSKICEDRKIYLNIVHSNEFKTPTDEKGNYLKESSDDSKWKYIPTEFRYSGKKNSMSGKRCDFYDVVIHSCVIKRTSSNEDLNRSILAYIVRKFCIFLNDKYKLYTDNVKILPSKKYKSIKHLPEIFKLTEKKEALKQDPSEKADKSVEPAKDFYSENKIVIPNKSENMTNTSSFYNLPKENKNIKKSTAKEEKPKVLIKEVKLKRNIPIHKKILSPNELEVKFDLAKFDEITLDNIDLLISTDAFVLKLENCQYVEGEDYDKISMNFDFTVNPEETVAKFNKVDKVLTVILKKS